MSVELTSSTGSAEFVAGVVEIAGGKVRDASAELRDRAAGLFDTMGSPEYAIPEERRIAVRKLLKVGGFSPTGRNRPAHELLVRDMQERGEFHHINNVVDVNNVVSLQHLVPISIFDMAKLGDSMEIRIADEGEGYIFNQSGHHIDLKRCIVCCTDGRPVGSPIKDSMETKIFEGATDFLGIIYLTTTLWDAVEMQEITDGFTRLLGKETGGDIIQTKLVSG